MLTTMDSRALSPYTVAQYAADTADDLLRTGTGLCAIPSQRAREEGRRLIGAAAEIRGFVQRQRRRDARIRETPGDQPGAASPIGAEQEDRQSVQRSS